MFEVLNKCVLKTFKSIFYHQIVIDFWQSYRNFDIEGVLSLVEF